MTRVRRWLLRLLTIDVDDIAGTRRSDGYAVVVAGSGVGGTEYQNRHLATR